MRIIHKLKACETKSITSAILNLPSCKCEMNYKTEHARLILNQSSDKLLEEALNQITTVECHIDYGRNILFTNESRYIWKLNPELKSNKTRLQLLRILKPLGILFTIRNSQNCNFLTLSQCQFDTFKIKWTSIYGNRYNFEHVYENNNYTILINKDMLDIAIEAINKYIIAVDKSRQLIKESIIKETIDCYEKTRTLR